MSDRCPYCQTVYGDSAMTCRNPDCPGNLPYPLPQNVHTICIQPCKEALAIASRLTALERTVKDYKEAVDAITAWADGKDRQAYEKAMKEIPDTPAPDKGEIIERYHERIRTAMLNAYDEIDAEPLNNILSDLIDEVRGMRKES